MRLSCQLDDFQPVPRSFRLDDDLGLAPDGINDVLIVPSVPPGKARVSAYKQPGTFIEGLVFGVELGRGRQGPPDVFVFYTKLGVYGWLPRGRDGSGLLGIRPELAVGIVLSAGLTICLPFSFLS